MAGKRITDLPETTITPDAVIEVAQNGASRSASLGQIIGRFVTITSDYTPVAGDRIGVDTSAGPVTVTLPSSGQNGDKIGFFDPLGTWETTPFTLLGIFDDDLICDVSETFHVIRLGSRWELQVGSLG